MALVIADTADLRQLIQTIGTRAQRLEQNERLTDKSVGGVHDATTQLAEQEAALTDKSIGATHAALQLLVIAGGADLSDTSPSGEQRARKRLGSMDPLGERQLPALWEANDRLRDKSVGSVRDATNHVQIAAGAALEDKTAEGEIRARDAIIAAALELVS